MFRNKKFGLDKNRPILDFFRIRIAAESSEEKQLERDLFSTIHPANFDDTQEKTKELPVDINRAPDVGGNQIRDPSRKENYLLV